MGFTNKFAESFARSKTMTGPERKANESYSSYYFNGCCINSWNNH